jgi:glycosyltransferase involved in cell wall biosynthesis
LDTPRISVVIPGWNARRWIGATIESVLSQTLPAHELVVVDDGSTDGMAEHLRAAYPTVRVIQQANAGVSAARNRGIESAHGDWIAFLDADDIWLPHKLQQQVALLQSQPQAAMACSGWSVWHSSTPTPPQALLAELQSCADDPPRWGGPSGWIYGALLLSCCVWTSTVVVRKDLLERTGGFDTGLKVGEDLDLWLRASRHTPIVRVARPLALYRQHDANTTRRAPAVNHQAFVVERALATWGLTGADGTVTPEREVQSALAKTWRDFAGSHLEAGHWEQARMASRRALALDRLNLSNWQLFAKAAFARGSTTRTAPP